MGTQSHLPVIRLPELQTFGCRICPDVGGKCCGNGEDIAEYLGVLHLATQARFPWSCGPRGDMKRRFSSVTWCLPSRRLRSAICCQILSSTRRIYLRLPLLTQLDMPQGMSPSIEDHSLDLPRRLGRLSGGPSLRFRHPGDALNLRLLLLRRSALKPSSWTRFTPQKKSLDPPRGFFGGRSLSSLCGPVGFRGVAPHHRPIHPEHFHQRFHMDRFPMGRIYFQLRVLCFGLTTATDGSMSTILHRYVVGMLRYLDDWSILAESRTTGIQARDRLLRVCAELGLQVIAESRP